VLLFPVAIFVHMAVKVRIRTLISLVARPLTRHEPGRVLTKYVRMRKYGYPAEMFGYPCITSHYINCLPDISVAPQH
jgi:hypothetical protein